MLGYNPSMSAQLYDCIVVGAGPGGLTASLFLARYRFRTLTFHHNSPRNIYSHGVHGFLGHHNILPTELLERGRSEVTQHGGLIIEACVNRVEKLSDDRFRVSTGGGAIVEQSFDARRLVLATGLRDNTPDCGGFADFYGTSVHHCPDCDAFENTGKHITVLGHGKKTVGFALNLLTWTDRLTLITNREPGDITDEHRAQLAAHDIALIEDRSITRLDGDIAARQLRRVIFDAGEPLECDALFFNLGTEPASDLHDQLGCRYDEECNLVWVDEHQQTSVQGVYAAGDITPHSQLAVVAAAEGAMAAIHIHKELTPEDRRV